ncbi:MAG: IclR family transcriptional regulator [Asticcacaulis sp.]
MGNSADSKISYAAPALEKGFNVIELLATAPGGLTMSEIAARLGHRSMSEIFRVIMVMERRGWLAKDTETDKYTVTYQVFDTVLRALPAHDLMLVATPAMLNLSREIEQSCHLVVLNGSRGLVILRQEGPGPTGFTVQQGAEIDPVRTASGHVLAAFSNPAIIKPILERDQNVTDKDLARIERVRRQGYEITPSIRTRGVTDMSCPILGFDGYAMAALTVPFLELIDGTQTVNEKAALDKLVKAAARISTAMGYASVV